MKRYLHDKSHYHLLTTKMGLLTPVAGFEVLAGDTVQIQNMGMIRVSPPATPVMHPVTVKFWNFFVPNRILDPANGSFSWEDFITGGEDGMYNTPPPRVTGSTINKNSVAAYFGITPGVRDYNNFLPKGYAKIWNEYFRDQQLQAELDVDTYTGAFAPRRVSWERDYFTSCRPEPVLGPEVTLPIGTTAPVIGSGGPLQAQLGSGGTPAPVQQSLISGSGAWKLPGDAEGGVYMPTSGAVGLVADLSAAGAININDFREAMALQRYQEARNMYGSRFTEYLRYLGISSSDGRLQRPELISTGVSTVNFSEVLGTYDGSAAGGGVLGQMGGHGIAGVRSRRARYFCEEHGHIISLMAVRPKSMYLQTQHKQFDRTTKEDYWQKELQAIGMEEVYTREVYADAASPATIFGWNNRYESFKRVPSRVSGDFRDTLEDWHLGRDLGQEPVLNDSFVECDPSDRIYQDQTDSDKLWCTIRNRVAVRSLLRKSTANRIL